MLIIGLTGGIGSGKSTVADLFAKKGITIIDTDQIAKDITEPKTAALTKIIEKFGSGILLKNQSLNRKQLRDIIFSDNQEKIWLEQLLHPLIREKITERIQLTQSPYCIVIIPLLFETKPNPLINRILVVDADEKKQIQRASQRDQLSEEVIKKIIQSQVTREQRLAKADDVIDNNGETSDLIPQIEKLHQFYLKLIL